MCKNRPSTRALGGPHLISEYPGGLYRGFCGSIRETINNELDCVPGAKSYVRGHPRKFLVGLNLPSVVA